MLIINSWFGRTGNNILQLIRAIHYAILNNHNIIIFENHNLLLSNKIKLQNIEYENKSQINDTFFNLSSGISNLQNENVLISYEKNKYTTKTKGCPVSETASISKSKEQSQK